MNPLLLLLLLLFVDKSTANLSESIEGAEPDDSPASGKTGVKQINAKLREHERSSLSGAMFPHVGIVAEHGVLPPIQTALTLQPRSTHIQSRPFPKLEEGRHY